VTSIRRSLLVYFLALEALVLGAVSLFVYETTQQTLQAKAATNRELLLAQYKDRRREEKVRLESGLAAQAHTLASLALAQQDWRAVPFQSVQIFGLLTASPSPFHYVQVPLWVAEARGRTSRYIQGMMVSKTIKFDEEDLLIHTRKNPATQYFQINGVGNTVWHSESLDGRLLPFDPDEFAKAPLYEQRADDLVLPPDLHLHRVTLKAPVVRRLFVNSTWPGRYGATGNSIALAVGGAVVVNAPWLGRFDPPPPRTQADRRTPDRSVPLRPPPGPPPERRQDSEAIWIQCACDTSHYQAVLANLEAQLATELGDLEAESATTLASLRDRLLAISLMAFAATLLGGCLLVGVGLSPLRRLSEAVSRISPKDFRLPFDEPRLPAELRPIVERLTQTLAMLKRAFAREKQAAADISHDLRTPVASLLMTTEVALRKPRTAEKYRESLAECRATAQHMNQLVERLLALARLDAQADTLRPQEMDAASLVEECAALVRPLAEAHGLTLEVQGNGPACVNADRDKLREVVTNLLHNAIEYNRPNGRVEVAVARQNGHLNVEVRDTGIGIAPEVREHIFERFYRVDPARQADGMHAGLGLAIVKSYVDLMGGTIAVESTEGQGSTFRVQLPA
jgi:heavy metal sensor kinase